MAENYEEIVRTWYVKMRPNFTDLLMEKYRNSNMRLADAENIYQDVFIAIHDNLRKGSIGVNCDWRNYILRVGMNMASKAYRRIGRTDSIPQPDPEDDEKLYAKERKINEKIEELYGEDVEAQNSIFYNYDAETILKDELEHTPEPCASIIRMSYFNGMSDKEIAAKLLPYRCNGKSVEVNAKAIRARRWLCMKDLEYRVKQALYNADIIESKPERRKRNAH